jgi:cell division protease FtsH
VRKSPERPVWLSSERRPISDLPPVQSPAEVKAASNGHRVTDDREHPPAAVVEVPEGGTIEPGV